MVADLVSLCPIFEVCAKETGYEVGGRLHEQWWCHTAAARQLKTTLKYIYSEEWER